MEKEMKIGDKVEFRTVEFSRLIDDIEEVLHVGIITSIDTVVDGLAYFIYSSEEGISYIIHSDDIAGAWSDEFTEELIEGELPF